MMQSEVEVTGPTTFYPSRFRGFSCNYDYVELVEPPGASVLGTGSNGSQQPTPWKRCGNWNSRLKLLRWRSVANRVDIRFNSDGSYGGHGFQLTATMEKSNLILKRAVNKNILTNWRMFSCCSDTADLNCPESRSISHQGHCYLIVPYPEIGWTAANEICKSIQVTSFSSCRCDADILCHWTSCRAGRARHCGQCGGAALLGITTAFE